MQSCRGESWERSPPTSFYMSAYARSWALGLDSVVRHACRVRCTGSAAKSTYALKKRKWIMIMQNRHLILPGFVNLVVYRLTAQAGHWSRAVYIGFSSIPVRCVTLVDVHESPGNVLTLFRLKFFAFWSRQHKNVSDASMR